MKIKEIKESTPAELLKQRRDLREEAFQLRLQQKSGQLENTARLRAIRREVARIETVLGTKRRARAEDNAAAKSAVAEATA